MKQTLLLSALFFLTIQQLPSANQRSVAILTPSNEQTADIHSARQALDVAGVPYSICQSVEEAAEYAIVLCAPRLDASLLTSQQCESVKNYVENGGVFIGTYIRESELYDLFGITNSVRSTSKYEITWNSSANRRELQWIDHPNERTIRLAGPSQNRSVGTIAYEIESDVEVLAGYEDGSPAVISRAYGRGQVYGLGYNLFSVIAKNLTNNDYMAELDYSNIFEPTTDVVMLFFRGVYQKHIAVPVWKHTCPGTGSSALMITHDVDSKTGVDTMGYFTRMENQRGIQTHYFVTTHYNSDGRMGVYYDENTVDTLQAALDLNHHIGSHSVAHAPDMYKSSFPIGEPGNSRENYSPMCPVDHTTGGSLYGETEVSKDLLEADLGIRVKSFRAGHLCYHEALADVLDDVGYLYNSTASAADVLTNFPFYAKENKSSDGRILPLIEIPMTISDVITGGSFDQSNYRQRVALWEEVTLNNDANGAPTVLLLHPNRRLKVTAQEMFLDRLPSSISIVPIDDFGAFWENRIRLRYHTDYDGSQMIVRMYNADELDVITLSFVIDRLPQNVVVKVIDENNTDYRLETVTRNDKTYVEITGESAVAKPYRSARLTDSSPVYFASDLSLTTRAGRPSSFAYRIFDIKGSLVHETTGFAPSGNISCPAPNLANGMYMVRFTVNDSHVNRILWNLR
ncbi:MAG: hypothetical protein ACLFSB_09070 [Chitinispirillaceae bacterium]